MKIYIDADGCPVVDETVEIAFKYGIKCIILCNSLLNFYLYASNLSTRYLEYGVSR